MVRAPTNGQNRCSERWSFPAQGFDQCAQRGRRLESDYKERWKALIRVMSEVATDLFDALLEEQARAADQLELDILDDPSGLVPSWRGGDLRQSVQAIHFHSEKEQAEIVGSALGSCGEDELAGQDSNIRPRDRYLAEAGEREVDNGTIGASTERNEEPSLDGTANLAEPGREGGANLCRDGLTGCRETNFRGEGTAATTRHRLFAFPDDCGDVTLNLQRGEERRPCPRRIAPRVDHGIQGDVQRPRHLRCACTPEILDELRWRGRLIRLWRHEPPRSAPAESPQEVG
jgi:hypothetical protein